MKVKELCRKKTNAGGTIVEFETGKLLVRLNDTYDNKITLDELIYVMACRKLTERQAKLSV